MRPAGFLRAGQLGAAEVIDLRAAAARAGVAHLPEVVVRAQLADPLGRQELPPDVVGLVVARNCRIALEDRGEESVRRQLPLVGQQRPRERDRLALEVVAEREVAQHLEERVVPERRPDVVEVVVLAADAHALLRRSSRACSRASPPEEHVLELVHPGVGEEQRRVLVRARAGSWPRCGGPLPLEDTRGTTRGSPWRSFVLYCDGPVRAQARRQDAVMASKPWATGSGTARWNSRSSVDARRGRAAGVASGARRAGRRASIDVSERPRPRRASAMRRAMPAASICRSRAAGRVRLRRSRIARSRRPRARRRGCARI